MTPAQKLPSRPALLSALMFAVADRLPRPNSLLLTLMLALAGMPSAAVAATGPLVAWGRGTSNTGTYPNFGQSIVPPGLIGATAAAGGYHHSLVLKNDGTVVGWGYNGAGQTTVPTGLNGVIAIAAGDNHSLALKVDGTVVAWGDNTYGQCNVPAGLTGVTAIAAGGNHNLVAKGDGTVVAWGYNNYGQANVPAGLTGVMAVAAGAARCVVLKDDGTVVAWGESSFGQSTVPAGLTGVVAIAAYGRNNLALKSNGTVVAWGFNSYGQIDVPAGLSGVVAVAAGESHSLALKGDGTLVAWGGNFFSQTAVPAGLSGVAKIAAGSDHNLALIGSGFSSHTFLTLAGTSGSTGSTDGTGSAARFNVPYGLTVDGAGNLYVTDQANNNIRKVTAAGVVTTLAGLAGSVGSTDGTGTAARFTGPAGVAVDAAGNLFVADSQNNTIRKVTAAGVVTTFAGQFTVDGGSADGTGSAARFLFPLGVALDGAGNLYVTDSGNNTIRKITPAGVVTTLAGLAGTTGSTDGAGSAARFNYPVGVAVDGAGMIYVTDASNHTIRRITPGGVVTTLAGLVGTSGTANGTGGVARFNLPYGVTVDRAGNLFVNDFLNHTIRKLTAAGVVSTLAGLPGTFGSSDGSDSLARFKQPFGIAADAAGNLYVADTQNNVIRKGLSNVIPGPPVITSASTASLTLGEAVGYLILADKGPITFGAAGLPAGLSVNTNTGFISGTPIATGTSIVTLGATNASGTGTATLTLTVAPPPVPVITSATAVTVNVNQMFTYQITGTGNPTNFNATGLPAGLSVNPTNGLISGALTSGGTSTITLSAGNAGGTGTGTLTLTVTTLAVPFITSPKAVSIGVGQSFNYQITAGNGPVSFGATGLPAGLTVNTASGLITGTPISTGMVMVVVSATNAVGYGSSALAVVINSTSAEVTYVTSTLAGLAGNRTSADGTGSAARFAQPYGVTVDGVGNVYVADTSNHTLRKVTPGGMVTTLAGLAGSSGSTDGTGSAARFNFPQGVGVDRAGNVYVADTLNSVIRKVTPDGVVTTLAGLDTGPTGIALDSSGNIYVAGRGNHTILKVSPGVGVTTLAGLASISGSTDDAGRAARFYYPSGVAVDGAGNVYVADNYNAALRKVTSNGMVTTVAGLAGNTGPIDGTGSAARFNYPSGVAVDVAGNVYVVDSENHLVRKITPTREVTTLAGLAYTRGYSDGKGRAARFAEPHGVAVDGVGNLYVADSGNHTVRKLVPIPIAISPEPVSQTSGLFGSVTFSAGAAGQGTLTFQWRKNGVDIPGETGTTLTLNNLTQLDGGYYSVAVSNGVTSLVSSNAALSVGPPLVTLQPLSQPLVEGSNVTLTVAAAVTPNAVFQWYRDGVAVPGATGTNLVVTLTNGNGASFHAVASNALGIAASDSARIVAVPPWTTNFIVNRTASLRGPVSTLAGLAGSRDSANGAGSAARFYQPQDVAVDSAGNIYVADGISSNPIRKISVDRVVSTLIGGNSGATGQSPFIAMAVAVDTVGNVYVADQYHVVFKSNPSGMARPFAGSFDFRGSSDGVGSDARFNSPNGLAVDSAGNVFVADSGNQTIRKISPAGSVSTLAGSAGMIGSTDGVGGAARFRGPWRVAVDDVGTAYVADSSNHTIRQLTSSGLVTTTAGLPGSSGSTDGAGSAARFNGPAGVAVDSGGNVYVADSGNHTIRKISSTGYVSTIAGMPGIGGSTDGEAGVARFKTPTGVATDKAGNVYVADSGNYTIRRISPAVPVLLSAPAYASAANPITLQGAPITLLTSASDPTGFTYQWAKNGVAISGATAAAYVITTPQAFHSGLYSVTVSRGAESVTLQQYLSVVPVLPQPSPAGDYVRIGSTLTVSALGTSNLVPNESGQDTTYRWAKDGVLLPGFENVPVLNFNVEESDAGLYSVQHYQGEQLVFSPGYRLRPLATTVITNQPVSASVISPAGTNFTVGASSSLLSYQWYFNGTPLAGATNATLSVNNTGAAQAGDYYAIVSNPVSSATSGVARLTVNFVPSPSITNTPATYVARRTGFTLGGSATGTGPISYQWLRNGTAITGATGTLLTVSAGELTSGNYTYSLRATNPYGTNTANYTVQVVNGFRTVPATYWPGQPMAVDIHYGPSATSANHAYTETLPTTGVSELAPDAVNTAGLPVGYHLTGRTVKLVASNISDNGVWDPVQGTVKWGPFFDTTPRTLRYTLVPPLGWTNSINLTGALSEDSVTTASLNNTIVLNPAHPADNGPATDQLLNIFEVAAYAAAWRNSRAWLVAPTPIDQNFLTSAGAIWKSGEYYQIVGGTPPANWQSAPLPAGFIATNYAASFVTAAAASPLGVAVRTTAPMPGATNGALNMTITATPAASIGVFLMEEQLPPGWTASNISNGGFFDANFNKLKWGPLYSSAPTVYSYTAVPPAGARGVHAFTGLAGFDGAIINIAGQSEYSLEAAPIAPYVLVQPVGSTVNSGASASFGVVAGGTAPLTYQWRRNGFNVAGATNATLTFTNVTTARNGNYDVVISSAGGSVTSFPATLTVLAVSFNGMMVFGDSLSDTGNSPAGPADQYFNGRWSNGSLWEEILAPKIGVMFDPALNYAVAGSETAGLAAQVASVSAVNGQLCTISSGGNDFINNLPVGADDFVWNGIINTAVNNITSAISSLYAKGARSFLVLNLPDMGQLPGTRQNAPAMMTYAGQKTVQFNTALANALTTLQGQKAGSSIKLADVYGRVNQILAAPGTFGFTQTTVGALQDGALGDKSFTGPGANYLFWDEIHPTTKGHAEISKAAEVALGIFTSTVTAPVITQQPQGATAAAGSRVLLGVGATGTAPLTYQWRRNGSPVAGATGAMLILANVQAASAGTYDAIVSNSAGSVTSSAASVTVTVPAIAPLLTSQPLSRTVVAGSNVTFSVTATGTPPLAYQWFRNGLPVPGASAAVLNLAGVNRAVSGVYTVGITNGGGGLVSSNAFLRVLVPQRFQPPMRLGDGRVRLVFGDNGGGAFQASDATNFIVYASTEATGRNASWTTVTGSMVLTNGQFMLEDTGAIGKPRRFYFIVDGDPLNFITDPPGN